GRLPVRTGAGRAGAPGPARTDGDRDGHARGDGDAGDVPDLPAGAARAGRPGAPAATATADEDDVDGRDPGGRGVRARRREDDARHGGLRLGGSDQADSDTVTMPSAAHSIVNGASTEDTGPSKSTHTSSGFVAAVLGVSS